MFDNQYHHSITNLLLSADVTWPSFKNRSIFRQYMDKNIVPLVDSRCRKKHRRQTRPFDHTQDKSWSTREDLLYLLG